MHFELEKDTSVDNKLVVACLEIPRHICQVRLVHVSGGFSPSQPPCLRQCTWGENLSNVQPSFTCLCVFTQRKILLIELQGLPATFEQAFAGHRSVLVNRMDLLYGLLEQLHDENLINSQHYLAIKVSIHSLF